MLLLAQLHVQVQEGLGTIIVGGVDCCFGGFGKMVQQGSWMQVRQCVEFAPPSDVVGRGTPMLVSCACGVVALYSGSLDAETLRFAALRHCYLALLLLCATAGKSVAESLKIVKLVNAILTLC